MSVSELFHLFVASHIVTGATGLLAFWVPVFAKKGGTAHRTVGKVFTVTMLLTGTAAIGISLCTLADPVSTHPHLTEHADFRDPALVRAIFGWMMLALATLTLNLAWYGWQCIRNRRDHTANRESVNLGLQAATFITATNCAVQGLLIGQPLMLGVSLIGWATSAPICGSCTSASRRPMTGCANTSRRWSAPAFRSTRPSLPSARCAPSRRWRCIRCCGQFR